MNVSSHGYSVQVRPTYDASSSINSIAGWTLRMKTSGAMDARHRPVHASWVVRGGNNVLQRGHRLTTAGKLLLVPRPWLQLHASLRPHELAGDMCEDICYGQRIFRLPLSEWWLKLRRAVSRRQSKPSTKLSLAANLPLSRDVYQEIYWELRSVLAHILFFTNINIVCNRWSVTWQKWS